MNDAAWYEGFVHGAGIVGGGVLILSIFLSAIICSCICQTYKDCYMDEDDDDDEF